MTDSTLGIICIIAWLGISALVMATINAIVKNFHREMKKRMRREIMK